jgi:hypothetical protein
MTTEHRTEEILPPESANAPEWFDDPYYRKLVSSDGQFYIKGRHGKKERRLELPGGPGAPPALLSDEIQARVVRHLDCQRWHCLDCDHEVDVVYFAWLERRCPECWSVNVDVRMSEIVPPRPSTFGVFGEPMQYWKAPTPPGALKKHIWGRSLANDGSVLDRIAFHYQRRPEGDSHGSLYLISLFAQSLMSHYQEYDKLSNFDRFSFLINTGNVHQAYFRATGSSEGAKATLTAFEQALEATDHPFARLTASHSFAMATIYLLDVYDEREASRLTARADVHGAAIRSLRSFLQPSMVYRAAVEDRAKVKAAEYKPQIARARYALADLLTRGEPSREELREALSIFDDLNLDGPGLRELKHAVKAAKYRCVLALPVPKAKRKQKQWVTAFNELSTLIFDAYTPEKYGQRWRWALTEGQWLMRVGQWLEAHQYLQSAVTYSQKDFPPMPDPVGALGQAEQFYQAYRALATNYIRIGWAFEGLALLETFRGAILAMSVLDETTRRRQYREAVKARREKFFSGMGAATDHVIGTLSEEMVTRSRTGTKFGPFRKDYELPGLLERVDTIREQFDGAEPTALISVSIDTTTSSAGAWLSVVVIRPPSATDPPCRFNSAHLEPADLAVLSSEMYRRPGSFREQRLKDLCQNIDRIVLSPMKDALTDSGCKRALVTVPGALSNLPFEAAAASEAALPSHMAIMPSFMFGRDIPLAKIRDATARVLVIGYDGSDLPHAGDEAEAVCNAFGDRATYIPGSECTKRSVVDLLNGKFDYIHLICHGYYDGADPLRSYLHFGGRDRTDKSVLRAGEIQQYVHMAERPVVSLSACSTALTADSRSNTWNGLPGAFLRAGAQAVIGTRWPVHDGVASSMMSAFYNHASSGQDTALDCFFAMQDSLRTEGSVEDWASFGYLGAP